MSQNSNLISEKLQLLSVSSGYVIFSIGDYFVQFMKTLPTDKYIIFEAVSHHFLDTVPSNAKEKFETLGFRIKDGNYYKEIRLDEISSATEEVKKIFTDIYQVNYNSVLSVEEEIGKMKESTKFLIELSDTKNWLIAVVICLVVVFLYIFFIK